MGKPPGKDSTEQAETGQWEKCAACTCLSLCILFFLLYFIDARRRSLPFLCLPYLSVALLMEIIRAHNNILVCVSRLHVILKVWHHLFFILLTFPPDRFVDQRISRKVGVRVKLRTVARKKAEVRR